MDLLGITSIENKSIDLPARPGSQFGSDQNKGRLISPLSPVPLGLPDTLSCTLAS